MADLELDQGIVQPDHNIMRLYRLTFLDQSNNPARHLRSDQDFIGFQGPGSRNRTI